MTAFAVTRDVLAVIGGLAVLYAAAVIARIAADMRRHKNGTCPRCQARQRAAADRRGTYRIHPVHADLLAETAREMGVEWDG